MAGKAPKPPDPEKTAAAQTGTNVSTALANTFLGNVNQVTPYGSLTYSYGGLQPAASSEAPSAPSAPSPASRIGFNDRDGNPIDAPSTGGATAHPVQQSGGPGASQNGAGGFTIIDPTSGATYNIPQTTVTQTLSPEQQRIFDETQAAEYGLARLGNEQIGRVSDSLSSPYSYDGLPSGGTAADLMAARPSYTQFNGDVATTAGDMRRGVDGAGDGFSYGVRGAGSGFQYSVDGAGQGIQRGISGAGQGIQSSVEGGGQRVFDVDGVNDPISYNIGNAGGITRSYNTDFEDSRRAVEEALFSRINPDLERQQEALRTRMANQGITLGSEAHDRGMEQYGRQANDARYGAVLAGGQEHSRLVGLEHQRASFQNAAQQQAFAQQHAQAVLKQQAEMAQAQQALAAAGFTNQAVNDQATENLARGQFVNQAQAQGFGQRFDAANFGNQAQAQDFGQRSYNAELNNAARQAAFGQRLASADMNNQSRERSFRQRLDSNLMYNDALSQAFGQNLAAAGLQMDATGRNNALADQNFRTAQSIFDAQNIERDRGIAEYSDQRNAALNEAAALLSGAQVQQPSFVNTRSAQIPTVDYAGLVNANYQAELAAHQQRQGLFGNLIGAGGMALGGYLRG